MLVYQAASVIRTFLKALKFTVINISVVHFKPGNNNNNMMKMNSWIHNSELLIAANQEGVSEHQPRIFHYSGCLYNKSWNDIARQKNCCNSSWKDAVSLNY